jgi:choline dehydrogenase-like flavoprotein
MTPLLLRRNGIGTGSGWLGRNLSVHPATNVRAVLDEDIDPWSGVPQSYYIDELASEGVMLEGITGPPGQAAMATPGSGAAHRELMLDVRRTASFGVMVTDTSRGRIREVAGRPVIRYDMNRTDAARFQRGFEVLADLFFAVGARKVIVPASGVPVLADGDTGPLRTRRIEPGQISTMAFHPLGTARAGANPGTSVVDPNLQVHGTRGLYVCDGSVVPSSLGVNPQVTIMALGVRLAEHLLSA